MKPTNYFPLLLILLTFLSSCEFIGDIFEAGVWVGVVIVVLVIVFIIWLIKKIL